MATRLYMIMLFQDEMLPSYQMRELYSILKQAGGKDVTWVEFERAGHMGQPPFLSLMKLSETSKKLGNRQYMYCKITSKNAGHSYHAMYQSTTNVVSKLSHTVLAEFWRPGAHQKINKDGSGLLVEIVHAYLTIPYLFSLLEWSIMLWSIQCDECATLFHVLSFGWPPSYTLLQYLNSPPGRSLLMITLIYTCLPGDQTQLQAIVSRSLLGMWTVSIFWKNALRWDKRWLIMYCAYVFWICRCICEGGKLLAQLDSLPQES